MSDGERAAQHVAEYGAARRRLRSVVEASDPAAFDAPAPATPRWCVRDVLAHVVGVADDAINQRLDGITTDAWTQAQVDRRRDRSVSDMLDEWDEVGPAFEAQLELLPPVISGQVLYDAVTHEHDIRHALGAPGARDVPAIGLVFEWMVAMRNTSDRPTLEFDTGDEVVVAGSGDVVASVRASRFELVRASTGRRSASEIAQYAWSSPVDPAAIIVAPQLFCLRAEPLNE
jgi:uncharacterized protein (TIGR03083 family)